MDAAGGAPRSRPDPAPGRRPAPAPEPAPDATAATTRVWVLQPVDAAHASPLIGSLPADERARAERLVAPQARARFVVARAALRVVLGAQFDIEAARVALHLTASGRPVVAHANGPHISIAHTSELALVAVHPSVPIGIDVEPADRHVGDAVIDRSCSPAELEWLARRDPDERGRAFLQLWTRKEAVAKADGRGLGLSVRTIEVHGRGPVRPPDTDAEVWVQDCSVGDGFVAALATIGVLGPIDVRHVSLPKPGTDDATEAFTEAVLRR